MENLLTAQDVARLLSVHPHSVYIWAGKGLIGRRVGTGKRKSWRFTQGELREFMQGDSTRKENEG